MSFFNFGREQLEKGLLNKVLEQVGIDDVGSFVNQFRNEAEHEAEISAQEHETAEQEEQLASFGGSLFNRVTRLYYFFSAKNKIPFDLGWK